MACRRSQVRSLSGPPFELIRTRRKAGFLLACFEQARFAPLRHGRAQRVSPAISNKTNAERRVFYWLVLSRRGSLRCEGAKSYKPSAKLSIRKEGNLRSAILAWVGARSYGSRIKRKRFCAVSQMPNDACGLLSRGLPTAPGLMT